MDLRSHLPSLDGARLSVDNATATGVTCDGVDATSGRPRVGVAELRWRGLAFDGRWPLPVRPGAGTTAGAAPQWELAPLEGLAGELHLDVTDAAWVLDADVRLPIRAGRIDFNRATVSHIGPDSSMGLSRMGIYVDAPSGRQYLAMLAATHLDGSRFEQRGALLGSLVTDRGTLALAPLLQAVLAGARPLVPAAGADALMARTRIAGQLQLADGPLGDADTGLVLTGAAAGRNRLTLSGGAGGRLLLHWPDFSAEQLRWSFAATAPAQAVHCTAQALTGSLDIECLRHAEHGVQLMLRAPELVLRGCQLQPDAPRAAPAAPRGGSAP